MMETLFVYAAGIVGLTAILAVEVALLHILWAALTDLWKDD